VDCADRGHIVPNCDGLVTDACGVPLLLRFADCAPVLIYDPVHRSLALVHSGWRGTVQGVVPAALEAMAREFGSRPADLIAAVGPSIGPCCYEVGDDVVDSVRAVFDRPDELLPGGGPPGGGARRGRGQRRFDMWAANHRWLVDGGVRQIEVCEICTACRTDEFYSHRAEAGKTGHFAATMMLQGRSW
jgi:polyphenol oxidase